MTPVVNRVLLTAVFLLPPGALQQAGPNPPPLTLFFEAASPDAKVSERALDALAAVWKDSYTALLVDVARFLPRSAPGPGVDVLSLDPDTGGSFGTGDGRAVRSTPAARTRARIVRFLERQTKQRFGDDLGQWREWMWRLPDDPHPDAAAFKAELYGRIDPRMRLFFPTGAAASIRLDEIDWGGVPVNGIPPLDHPRVIAAADASYLKDSHIVFGVAINGEARAYPRRVLAWHEMAHDRLGGLEITVVYCTLCGTVIPYESVVGGRRFTFGTSGLLYRSNKLMFDQETASLWSMLDGSPAVGPLVGSGLRLKARPVVTTTWGEWRAQHPGTTVLSIETGHARDYSEGAAYRDYFATDRLMFRVPKRDSRLKNKDEVLGILVPAPGGGRQAAAYDVRLLAKRRVFETAVEGRRLVIVTSANGANRVYDAGDIRFSPKPSADGTITDLDGGRWTVAEESLVLRGANRQLARVPAWRAFWFGWYAQFPETLLFK
ncbi:MAG: DUF3179 domain-containing protein [Vicinamibacterales bacterium]